MIWRPTSWNIVFLNHRRIRPSSLIHLHRRNKTLFFSFFFDPSFRSLSRFLRLTKINQCWPLIPLQMILFIALICLILLVLPVLVVRFFPAARDDDSQQQLGNVLLVIAHPDDECLFFSPTLLSLRQPIYILCLSNGSNPRADELRRSAEHLHIKDLQIIDDQINLKDSQSVNWSAEAILSHVQRAIRHWKISTLISFDQGGVSGHCNHSAIYFALLHLPRPSSLQFFALESVPIYRKYLTCVDLIRWMFFRSIDERRRTFLLPRTECFTPHRSMLEHRSQLVWFRYLYVLFSQYIWINQLRKIF